MSIVSKTLIKTYDNFYEKRTCTAELTFTLQQGLGNLDEAKNIVAQKWNPNHFSYIKVDNELYAVAIETLGRQIILSKELCYFRNGSWSIGGFCGTEKHCDFSEILSIPTVITKPRTSSWWNDTVAKDIKSLFTVEVISSVKGDYIKENSITLLARILFDTLIPVFELNVIDAYFSSYHWCPSRQRLWKEGICAVNPYKDIYIYKEKGKPYTFAEYKGLGVI